jgi:hypothetical protein
MKILLIALSLWLLFNLFLFSWLGLAGSVQLSRRLKDNFRAAVRGLRRV